MMGNLRISACVAALAAAALYTPAFAQAEAGHDQAQDAGGVSTGDIVVTAQRRSENLQEVPIAVTAIDSAVAEKLNIRDLQNLQIVTPGLSVSTGVGYAMTYIRGVGANFSNPGVENPVAVYIDGAYVERGKGGNLDMVDVASVQVLKGPQGTLWGRNATGGAILISTADPEFDTTGHVTGEYGNLGHRLIEGVVNVPLSDTVAVRVAGRYRTDGGYIRNLPDNYMFGWQDDYAIRGKLLWKPSSDFSATLMVEHDARKASLGANAEFLPDNYCLNCSASAYTHPYADPYTTAINLLNNGVGVDSKNDIYNLKLNYKLDKFTINSVTAYNHNKTLDAFEGDLTDVNTPANPNNPNAPHSLNFIIPSSNKTFTQNLTATTDLGGMIEGMVGVDYLNDRSTYIINVVQNLSPPFTPIPLAYVKTTSFSPFAEVNIKPLPGLTLTAGGRYTWDKRHGNRVGEPDANVKFHSFSPRLVIAYDAGLVNLYASYNRGSKAGGLSTPAVPMQKFLPETLDGYEIGAKFVSADRRLRANISAFYYDYKQLQTVAINQDSSQVGTVQNPDAKIHGIDFDGNWRATEWLQLFGGATYLKSHYVNYTNAGVQVPVFDASGNVIGTSTGTEDLSGVRLPHAPKYTAFLGATLSADLSSAWKGDLTAFLNYTSTYDFFPAAGGPIRADRQPGYTTIRMSGSIWPTDGKYKIGFFVDNLTDKKTYNLRFTTAPFGAFQLINRPRTYGVRASVNF